MCSQSQFPFSSLGSSSGSSLPSSQSKHLSTSSCPQSQTEEHTSTDQKLNPHDRLEAQVHLKRHNSVLKELKEIKEVLSHVVTKLATLSDSNRRVEFHNISPQSSQHSQTTPDEEIELKDYYKKKKILDGEESKVKRQYSFSIFEDDL